MLRAAAASFSACDAAIRPRQITQRRRKAKRRAAGEEKGRARRGPDAQRRPPATPDVDDDLLLSLTRPLSFVAARSKVAPRSRACVREEEEGKRAHARAQSSLNTSLSLTLAPPVFFREKTSWKCESSGREAKDGEREREKKKKKFLLCLSHSLDPRSSPPPPSPQSLREKNGPPCPGLLLGDLWRRRHRCSRWQARFFCCCSRYCGRRSFRPAAPPEPLQQKPLRRRRFRGG